MSSYSTDVSASDTILATQYNNLRKDIFEYHNHDGINSAFVDVVIRGTDVADNYILAHDDTEYSSTGNGHAYLYFDCAFAGTVLVSFKVKATAGTGPAYYSLYCGAGAIIPLTQIPSTDYTTFTAVITVAEGQRIAFGVNGNTGTTQVFYIKECRIYIAWKAHIDLSNSIV